MEDLDRRGDATARSIVLGSFMFLIGVACISASVLLVIGLKLRQHKGRLCHRNYLSLMLVFSDCIQLFPMVFLGSPTVAFQRNVFPFSYEVSRALYSLSIFGWFQSSFLMIVMALNRYVFICESPVSYIFEFPRIRWIVRACWLASALIVVLTQYILPGLEESFLFTYYTIVPVRVPAGHDDWAFFNMNIPLVIITLLVSCFCYAAILRRMRASTASVAANLTDTEENRRFGLQFLSIFVTYTAAAIAFRLIPPLVEMNNAAREWNLIATILLMLNASSNAAANVAMNKEVRQQICSLFFRTEDSSTSSENSKQPLLNSVKSPVRGGTVRTENS